MSDSFYFRQLLAGRDFAVGNDIARQMLNFAYAIGDRETGEAILVDPSYHPTELVEIVEADGLKVVGVIATHFHADHIGGDLMGYEIPGIAELLQHRNVPIHVQTTEVAWVTKGTGVEVVNLVQHEIHYILKVGKYEIEFIHTPGHTPGSQCMLVNNCLISGDTLFVDGCGRTDFPYSQPEEMYISLNERLAGIKDEVVLYPGHLYSAERHSPMGEVRKNNFVLAPVSKEQWLAMFAR